MTPGAAGDQKTGGQNADLEGHFLLRNSTKFKEGVMNDPQNPKITPRNPKLGVIFAKCAPMTPCPPGHVPF